MRNIALLAALCLSTPPGLAQAQTSLAQVADSSPFRPLDLAAPNDVRTGSGRPGPKYWQQQANYKISATLDPARNELRGRETIHYTNHSPETLPYLWLFVEQNLCAPNSITNQLNQPPLVFLGSTFDFSCQGFNGGGHLESLRIGGVDAKRTVYGTTMRIDLPTPLAPGASVDIEAAWHFNVPPQGGGRMGHDGPLYEMAQWYPRMVVYDDVHGWNHEPYIGAGEFYLEYGNFDVSLTVPASYIVAATGELANPEEVLTATQRTRLAAARKSETPVAIIGADEVGDVEKTRPRTVKAVALRVNTVPWLTWHYTATNVRDLAFAAGPNFRWDASGYNGILIEDLYRPTADKWTEVNRMGREAIKYFSEQWYPYPWSHATTIEGPIEGMEYPMLTFTPNSPAREDQQWVIAHEFGHEWFPMTVGSNERLYPWMDEGFNTFIDLGNAAKYFQGTPYGDSIEVHPLHLYADHAKPGDEQPLITNPTQVRNLFWVGYQKPALMLQMLRYEVLGKDRFDAAFREYIKAWAFKHPTPADFFRLMRDESGMDLDWFWRGWIYSTARLDQSVDSVATRADGGSNVYLGNHGTMVMPAEISLTFADGTRTIVKLPIEMWNLGSQFVYRVPEKKRVTRAEIDPRHALPDIDRANNVWQRPGPG
ncbi:MAG TPA: M1 family metallopeptidase [Gemmatimonadaceae bacterium]|nr:M1 family metallopeptidase [Gemmatimonadaceae bacterium]